MDASVNIHHQNLVNKQTAASDIEADMMSL